MHMHVGLHYLMKHAYTQQVHEYRVSYLIYSIASLYICVALALALALAMHIGWLSIISNYYVPSCASVQ